MTTPQKLPQLLANLPKDGLNALVKPTSWPIHQFYKITRTKLKFRPSSSSSSSSEVEVSEGLKVGGKAWGMIYRNGHLQTSTSPLAKPDTPIRGSLKFLWTTINPSSLPPSLRSTLDQSDKIRKEGERIRSQRLKEGRERKRARKQAEREGRNGMVEEAENA